MNRGRRGLLIKLLCFKENMGADLILSVYGIYWKIIFIIDIIKVCKIVKLLIRKNAILLRKEGRICLVTI